MLVAMPLFGLKKGGKTMRKYLYSENGFVEKAEWKPNCWVSARTTTISNSLPKN